MKTFGEFFLNVLGPIFALKLCKKVKVSLGMGYKVSHFPILELTRLGAFSLFVPIKGVRASEENFSSEEAIRWRGRCRTVGCLKCSAAQVEKRGEGKFKRISREEALDPT
ncbi:hypothetical protein TDIS_0655 [Thermosulfurimonas dismutans]|uniref:Uncharacterized protein n=1 Tax=Thermosulfurimonas dismutans TaxID=999894 RepID=A0A179D5R0_9BACT|nr:hypothetical protein TDIS_0655 [Thermosulfurimonas dismutans]